MPCVSGDLSALGTEGEQSHEALGQRGCPQPPATMRDHAASLCSCHIQAPAAVLSLRVMGTGQSANCSSLSLLSGNASSFISCHHSSEQSSACAQVRLFSLFLGVHCILQSRLKKSLQNKFWRWQFVHQHSTER